jgi:hypothetical protein
VEQVRLVRLAEVRALLDSADQLGGGTAIRPSPIVEGRSGGWPLACADGRRLYRQGEIMNDVTKIYDSKATLQGV